MQSQDVISALGALAQEHRLAVFRLLVQAGPDGLAAGALADTLGIAPSSMSFHLSQLSHSGLVSQRRESRSIIYTADYATMTRLVGFLIENCCGGTACVPEIACAPNITEERTKI